MKSYFWFTCKSMILCTYNDLIYQFYKFVESNLWYVSYAIALKLSQSKRKQNFMPASNSGF